MVHNDAKLRDARNRTILITGCSSGIGLAAAHTLRALNWRVFASARKSADVAMLQDLGFETYRLDYQDSDNIRETAEKVLQRAGGRLDALFNNGAYAVPGAIEDLPTAALRDLFDANFFGWHELTRAVLPAMRAAGAGRIIQCSSILGFTAMKYRGAYNASKFALEGYSDTLRMELTGTGIHVSLIEPGPIATRFTENAMENFYELIEAKGLDHSPFRSVYETRMARMKQGEPSPFKLPPTAVVKVLVEALEAKRPKPRYRVTTPTKVMAVLKRVLPTRALDWTLRRAADGEEK